MKQITLVSQVLSIVVKRGITALDMRAFFGVRLRASLMFGGKLECHVLLLHQHFSRAQQKMKLSLLAEIQRKPRKTFLLIGPFNLTSGQS